MKWRKRYTYGWLVLLLLCLSFSGCIGVELIDPWEIYSDETSLILEHWKEVVQDWETKAKDPDRKYRDLDAEDCYEKIENLILAWDKVEPPKAGKEYHNWMRKAMDYEKEAFRVMRDYYQLEQTFEPSEEELNRLRNLAFELWVFKDKALFEANKAIEQK